MLQAPVRKQMIQDGSDVVVSEFVLNPLNVLIRDILRRRIIQGTLLPRSLLSPDRIGGRRGSDNLRGCRMR